MVLAGIVAPCHVALPCVARGSAIFSAVKYREISLVKASTYSTRECATSGLASSSGSASAMARYARAWTSGRRASSRIAHASVGWLVSAPAIMLRLTLRISASVSPRLSGSRSTLPWMQGRSAPAATAFRSFSSSVRWYPARRRPMLGM